MRLFSRIVQDNAMEMAVIKTVRGLYLCRRKLRAAVCSCVIVYLMVCIHFYVHQERYLLEPNAHPTGGRPSSLREVEHVLPVRHAEEIHYRSYSANALPSRGTVFYLHGNRGNMDQCEWEIEFLIEMGYDVWTMDYRGYGASAGPISEIALKVDAKAVFDKLTESDSSKPVIIWGRSFGSGLAASVAAAATTKPGMLVLETPYWSLIDAVRQKHPYLPAMIFRYELPVSRFLESAGCPIHLIHGTLDEKIPHNSSDRLHEYCQRNGIAVTGHSIMCGRHNLRELAEFERIAASILTTDELTKFQRPAVMP